MTSTTPRRLMPYCLGTALLAAVAHLGWELTHGGVKSHHLLHNPDMPAFSNGWGLLVLPLLGMLASRSVTDRTRANGNPVTTALMAFSGALLAGAALAADQRSGTLEHGGRAQRIGEASACGQPVGLDVCARNAQQAPHLAGMRRQDRRSVA